MTQKQTSNKQFTGRNAAVEINDSKLVGEFIAEKTSDLFWEVKFLYGSKEWSGAIPVILRYQGYDASSKDASELIEHFHSQLDFTNESIIVGTLSFVSASTFPCFF
jgi:hypothetical protein